MKAEIRTDCVPVIGCLPDDPDNVPVAPPSGFIWMMGGAWHGKYEAYGMADVRVSVDGDTIDFHMTLADALSLRDLLDQTISIMRGFSDDEED